MFKWKDNNGTCPGGWIIGGFNLGLERTVVQVGGEPYLGRWIVYILGWSFRLHKFYKGDDQRAFHSHPWPFWTFPLCRGYFERVPIEISAWEQYLDEYTNWVKGWRVHYRRSSYRHIVLDPPKPFWTIVITARKNNAWGFYPTPDKFIPWREWK